MVPVLANTHTAALAHAEDTREVLLLAPTRSSARTWTRPAQGGVGEGTGLVPEVRDSLMGPHFPISWGSSSAQPWLLLRFSSGTQSPQPVTPLGEANWGEAFSQPPCRAVRKGKTVCASASWTQVWKDQAIMKQGVTIREGLPFILHIKESKKKKKKKRQSKNKGGVISALLLRRAKSGFSYQLHYFCSLITYSSNKLLSVLTFVSGFRLVEI